ncbi:pentatricopeptide repeat-containing protein At4g33170-like [Macadamia integrifolia]|uniref:pentatricopeptide repeat-containing protein At4g33170-like n=1 Tax=Macadamia integrifolia TaxID=60698 RepID=UPI001C4F3C00|nr:pentatricopeptide repeat-containing protein At4g33170-like [Macadamia integrifolia]
MIKDSISLAHVIQTCARTRQLSKGKQLHAHLICSGYQLCIFVSNHLVNMYSKSGELDFARNMFDTMPYRNLVSWTALISGLSQNGRFAEALRTFIQMRNTGENPTQFAFSNVIQSSASLGSLEIGKQLHSLSMKMGFNDELFVGSNLADMYSKCGALADAYQIFSEMPYKDQVSWTAMIDGYTKSGNFEKALLSFRKMIHEGVNIDQYVFCSTLGASGALKDSTFGTSLHSWIVKLGFESETYVGNALTDMYSKAGDMESAFRVFGIDSDLRNVVSYTSLIDGFVETEQIDKALSIFVELQRHGIEPNEFTFSSLLKACASQAALEQGTQLHAQVIKTHFDDDPFVYSILVDMYGKCGLLDYSVQVFDEIRNPTEIAWNSLLGVFAQHGLGQETIKIFSQMIQKGIQPNEITFISLLIGCSHAGLVEQGLDYFYSMEKIYGVEPRQEHYSCIIDLLGRSGRLKEAEDFINSMPFEPNTFGWCSFLAACRTHSDKERGEFAAAKLMRLEPENSGTHVLLSNIYATAGQWEDVRNIRKIMRDGKVKKLPGYSWVDVDNKTHVFGVEDWSHPQKREIYEKLENLFTRIREAGYVPYTGSIPFNMEESMKERLLHHHSERIAVAFALISMPTGKPIIVKKNIRVCLDCHSAMKFISKVEGRKIIVRDNSRFHHFVDGSCSCGDYW